ncbi:CobW family GTP-binding protein [Magnetofaba australis]|uniref:Putative cobalamin synthesis protein, P47K n=1 Tax=Magnetofaba australis IT-1 TaxID=1434232 RepID=A0A1Y2K9J5_9PROT|nr:GTP-binding protein [Magnetofaba australis]OSM07632.1 putative cobalamin synthesis protein, P47K [Magnetofaba australis IT-1]
MVPVNIITGYLGVGKTTVIRNLLAQAKPGQPWAVLVNEFGDVAIDQGAMGQGSSGGVAIREVAGGCICCTLGGEMDAAIGQILDQVKPARLLVEPTGLGHPGGVIEALTQPKYFTRLRMGNVLCLVDPRRLADPQLAGQKTFRDQASIADILLAAKADRCEEADLAAFHAFADGLFPPKLTRAEVYEGRLDAGFLDLKGRSRRDVTALRAMAAESGHAHVHDAPHARLQAADPTPDAPTRLLSQGLGHAGCGWIFHADNMFSERPLVDLLRGVERVLGTRPARLKGIFRVGPTRRVLINRVGDEFDVDDSVAYWRDSRVEVIAPELGARPDWDALEKEMCAIRWG